ncbi:MAG: MBL fold metallo-hydrolase [Rhodobacteraceae bacterium]|nr:MBL fold metallo-hydrolase [Paracoccaceae bacterium]
MSLTVPYRVGDIDVTILTDGTMSFDPETFPGTDPSRIAALLAEAGEDSIRTNFNAVLVHTAGKLVLVDAGPRDLFGPTAGNLPAGLREAGVDPEEVEVLYFTHLHPDHIAGAIDAEGRAIFPNAEVVMLEAERAFWSDDANFSGADDTLRAWMQLARGVLAAYGERLRPISGAAEVAPGMTALPLPGHTPGHAGFRLASGDAQFAHVGDIVHAPFLQVPDPEISVAFDADADAARAARKRLLAEVAADGIAFTGGHLLRPAVVRARADGAGYRLETLAN